MAVAGRSRGGQNHAFVANTANNKQAQLTSAYQELGKELGSEKLNVVGGYTIGRVIGEGSYGSVHLATHRLTGTRCAIKKIPKSATTHLTREIHHHRQLHHPHIVHLHEIVATENHVWLVSELCSGGELFDYLVERGRILEGEARRLFGELTLAVACMHMRGVVHRDLKLENVLLDGELRIKLGDLGFAREYQRGRLMETFCGTTGYASPEMLSGRKYLGEETDIWSLGVILYTLLCGGLPFDDDDDRAMKELILIGEYEEPEWLSQEARSIIRGMLQSDPVNRFSISAILAHPWFKMTIVDDIQSLVPTGPSLPPSPNLGVPSSQSRDLSFSEPWRTTPTSRFLSPHASGASPLASPPAQTPQRTQTDSEPSETSIDCFDSDLGRTSSGVTTPTTGEDEEQHVLVVKRDHSGEFSHTEKVLELLHSNGSQSTIRDSDAAVAVRNRIAVKGPLEGQQELDEEAIDDRPMSDALLPVPQHSRTPSRTKRQSITSALVIERRHSYNTSSVPGQFLPQDYLSTLSTETSALFSTPSERALLQQLSEIGFDTGQLTHSVGTDACDTSAATWWFLRQRQTERGETDEVVQARAAAKARRRDRAAAYQREARMRARVTEKSPAASTDDQMANVKFQEETIIIPAPSNFARLGAPLMTSTRSVVPSPDIVPLSETTSPLDLGCSSAAGPRTRDRPDPLQSASHPQTPPREAAQPSAGGSPIRVQARSPSITMLQRATSAFALGGKRPEDTRALGPSDANRSLSPTKLMKPPPKSKPERSESDTAILVTAKPSPDVLFAAEQEPGSSTSAGSLDVSQAPARAIPNPAMSVLLNDGAVKTKTAKRDSVWTTLRYLFNEDKRRRKQDPSPSLPELKILPPAVVLSRGMSARTSHMTRTNQPAPTSRRASIDGGRPVYSRRSSSVKSRRSSYGSVFATEVPDPLTLRRRSSHRSAGSATPTSENDYPSRPSSSHSAHRNRRSFNSLASPILSADPSGKFRPSVSPSPLHDYHRRPPGGTASRRVQHGRFLPASQILRHGSVSSGHRSAASSRASSIDKGKDHEVPLDSDYDSARDDSVFHTRRPGAADRRSSNFISAPQMSDSRAPVIIHTTRSRPIRDVFQQKDDEWISDDEPEPGGYAGGLGQNRSKLHAPQTDRWRSRASTHPNVASANKHSAPSGGRHRHSGGPRQNNDEVSAALTVKDPQGADAGRRRGGLPETRIAQPPPIEEEEEDE